MRARCVVEDVNLMLLGGVDLTSRGGSYSTLPIQEVGDSKGFSGEIVDAIGIL
jgi:hypothetical protein